MEFDKLIGIFLILVVTYLFKSNVVIIFGTMFGLGCALQLITETIDKTLKFKYMLKNKPKTTSAKIIAKQGITL
mgnify:CR=1 FL=1